MEATAFPCIASRLWFIIIYFLGWHSFQGDAGSKGEEVEEEEKDEEEVEEKEAGGSAPRDQ